MAPQELAKNIIRLCHFTESICSFELISYFIVIYHFFFVIFDLSLIVLICVNMFRPVFQSHPVAVKLLNFPTGINKDPSYLILQKHVAHKLHVPQCISLSDMRLKRLAIICP